MDQLAKHTLADSDWAMGVETFPLIKTLPRSRIRAGKHSWREPGG